MGCEGFRRSFGIQINLRITKKLLSLENVAGVLMS